MVSNAPRPVRRFNSVRYPDEKFRSSRRDSKFISWIRLVNFRGSYG
jgi:hypothetical protein